LRVVVTAVEVRSVQLREVRQLLDEVEPDEEEMEWEDRVRPRMRVVDGSR
jgi:hypothetical protein